MHDTAAQYGNLFFDTYIKNAQSHTIVDIGSQDVNGSLRSKVPPNNTYIGVDFVAGHGVDIVINDPYCLPFESESVDVIVSSSCFEHSEFFWLLFNEALRILKPTGLLYINSPANGDFHRYPVDCWRFYPDSGKALENWGKRSGYNCCMLESFIGTKTLSSVNDFVAVFLKDENFKAQYPVRMINSPIPFSNARLHNEEHIFRCSNKPFYNPTQ